MPYALKQRTQSVQLLTKSLRTNKITLLLYKFQDNEEQAWLDKIERRFTWFKKNLIEFEVLILSHDDNTIKKEVRFSLSEA